MSNHISIRCCMVLGLLLGSVPCYGVDDVGGALITLTNTTTAPNGAWSWFQDERAIVDDSDPNNTKLLVSSVSSAPNGSTESGDIDLLWLNIDTGQQGEFELYDRLQRDDHDSAAIWQRPSDGRYVVAYGRHGTDQLMRWRLSTNPGDPTLWNPEATIDASPGNNDGVTYNNLEYLAADNGGTGRLYNFTRSVNWDPNVITSDDEGATWSYAGKLLTQGGGSDRPYVRYFSDGEKVHFISTEGHPRNENNSIYHGYVQDGAIYNSAGELLDDSVFTSSTQIAPTDLTQVLAANTTINGVSVQRGWTVDVAISDAGEPIVVFSARDNGNDNAHRFYYATANAGDWTVNELAAAGGYLYASENDYTGLVSLDPNDPSILFMSSDIDPRNGVSLDKYEIFRGQTSDNGASWSWAPITYNSTVDNLRPLVPEWNPQETALVWMRGTYNTYQSWDTEVVALTDITPLNFLLTPDFNSDGSIDILDYRFLLASLNQTFTDLQPSESFVLGDLNGDLITDFYDLAAFRIFYDAANGAGSFSEQALLIPEPNSLTLAIAGVLLAVFRVVRKNDCSARAELST